MKKVILLITVIGLSNACLLGNPSSPDSLLQEKSMLFYSFRPVINPWSLGSNPAGLLMYRPDNISRIRTGYEFHETNNRWAQAPGETGRYYLETEGLRRIRSFVFNGSFAYNNNRYDDLMYNNTMSFDNRRLYIIGDTINGKQKCEGFRLTGGFAFPVSGKVFAGFETVYENGVAGKMRDPRNLNKISLLELNPGLILQLGSISLGISGGPVWENNETTISVMQDAKHNLFQFLGLGYFESIWNIYSYSMRYDKTGYQAALQLRYSRPGWSGFHAFRYTGTSEELKEGTGFRLLDGITSTARVEYTGNTTLHGKNFLHYLQAGFYHEKLKGTEVEQHSVSIYDGYVSWDSIVTDRWVDDKHIINDMNGTLSYQLFRKGATRPFRYRLTAGADVRFYSADQHPVETYGFYNAFTVGANIAYEHFFRIRSVCIDPALGFGFRKSMMDELSYRVETKFFAAVPEADFRYISADYYLGHASLNMSKKIDNKFFSEVFMETEARYLIFPELPAGEDHNMHIRFSLGVIF